MVGGGKHGDGFLIFTGGFDGGFRLVDIEGAGHGGQCDADGEEELEEAGALAARGCRKALGEVERHDHGDESSGGALKEASGEQQREFLGYADDADGEHEHQCGDDHQLLTTEKVGQRAGNDRGNR